MRVKPHKQITWTPDAAVKRSKQIAARRKKQKELYSLPQHNPQWDNDTTAIQEHLVTGAAFYMKYQHFIMRYETRFDYPPVMMYHNDAFPLISDEFKIGTIAIYVGSKQYEEATKANTRILKINRPLMLIDGVIYVMMTCSGFRPL